MEAYVIKGWHSNGFEFFVAHIERGDGCWAEEESLADAQLFSSIEEADRVIQWLLQDPEAPACVIKSVTVCLVA